MSIMRAPQARELVSRSKPTNKRTNEPKRKRLSARANVTRRHIATWPVKKASENAILCKINTVQCIICKQLSDSDCIGLQFEICSFFFNHLKPDQVKSREIFDGIDQKRAEEKCVYIGKGLFGYVQRLWWWVARIWIEQSVVQVLVSVTSID